MFVCNKINIEDSFNKLKYNVKLENIIKGRFGAILVDLKNETGDIKIPIIRTTTSYNNSVQTFNKYHYEILDKIKEKFKNLNIEANNVLFEIYGNYFKMGYHSDQELDLKENSYICLFSCYSNPQTKQFRKLKIKNKNTKEIKEIILYHNSVVVFSTSINKKFLHKIVLESNISECEWLGMTFRMSKTYINIKNNIPYFEDNIPLLLANDEHKKEFYKMRRKENKNTDFIYPDNIRYTISKSDLFIDLNNEKSDI